MDKLLILLLLIGSYESIEGSGCQNNLPDTTAVYQHGEYCYQFVDKERYWTSARDYCRKYGGHLVRIDGEEINAWITGKLDDLDEWDNSGVWIGLHDINEELTWMWVTDDKYLHTSLSSWNNWSSGHPGAFWHSSRDCIRMVRRDNWRWHETFCSALNWKYKFICQYTAPEVSVGGAGSQFGLAGTSLSSTSAPEPTQAPTPAPTEEKMKTRSDSSEDEEEEEEGKVDKDEMYSYHYGFQNKELPIPMAQIQDDVERKQDGGIIGGTMACLVAIIIILIILLFVVRRRREKTVEAQAALPYTQDPSKSPTKDLCDIVSTPEEQDYRMNIYVAAPDSCNNLQSNPLPPVPSASSPTTPLPATIDDPDYAEVKDARVKVIERNDLEQGGSKVKVMISRGKGSNVSYVQPDSVGRAGRHLRARNERSPGDEGAERDVHVPDTLERGGYLPMNGSPKNLAKRPPVTRMEENDDVDGYDRPSSPVKSLPIRALHYDTPQDNRPIRTQAYDTPPARGPIRKQDTLPYDVPRPEPIYAEIPELAENIYEDLDEHQLSMRESTA